MNSWMYISINLVFITLMSKTLTFIGKFVLKSLKNPAKNCEYADGTDPILKTWYFVYGHASNALEIVIFVNVKRKELNS